MGPYRQIEMLQRRIQTLRVQRDRMEHALAEARRVAGELDDAIRACTGGSPVELPWRGSEADR